MRQMRTLFGDTHLQLFVLLRMADLCQQHHGLRLDRNQLGSETIF